MKKIIAVFGILMIVFFSSKGQKLEINENAVAVIIGNENYGDSCIPDADFANNDAKLIKEILIKGYGYLEKNIILIENASKKQFDSIFGDELNHFGALYNLTQSDVTELFVYYSGHGIPDPKSKQGYFFPINSNPENLVSEGYSLNTFYKNLSVIPFKSITVLIEASFNGSSDGGDILFDESIVPVTIELPIMELPNSLIMLSASPGENSKWLYERFHSELTYYFVKGLLGEADENKDFGINLNEIKSYLEDSIKDNKYLIKTNINNDKILVDNYQIIPKRKPSSLLLMVINDDVIHVNYPSNVFLPEEDQEFMISIQYSTCRNLKFDYSQNGFEFIIYNRWGEKLFESDHEDKRWNGRKDNVGKKCPAGSYYFIFNYKFIGEDTKKHTGVITLVR